VEVKLPADLDVLRNKQVLEYLQPRSCHSDIIDPLDATLVDMADVDRYCPSPAGYKYMCWYTAGTVFAFAAGMHMVSLRLPSGDREAAIASGAVLCREAGCDWVSLPFDDRSLGKWSRRAYEYAKHP